jgi:transcription elongation factor S-II
VGKLRTHDDKKVADLAKETVRKWKNDVAGQKDKPASTQPTKTASPVKSTGPVLPQAAQSFPVPAASSNGKIKSESSASPAKKARDATSDGISKSVVGEKIRDNCIILLYNAICLDSIECIPSHDTTNR